METNKNNIEKIIIPIPVTTDSEKIEEVEAIEIKLQDTKYVAKNMLVSIVEKPKGNKKYINLKQVFQSLVHACRWSQLKRQLNKETLLIVTKRQRKKIALGAGFCLLYFSK